MYFAVKTTLKIGEKIYVPCVCYRISNALKETVDMLVEKDLAYTSDTFMVYESGRRIDNLKKKSVKKSPKVAKVEAKVETEKE